MGEKEGRRAVELCYGSAKRVTERRAKEGWRGEDGRTRAGELEWKAR